MPPCRSLRNLKVTNVSLVVFFSAQQNYINCYYKERPPTHQLKKEKVCPPAKTNQRAQHIEMGLKPNSHNSTEEAGRTKPSSVLINSEFINSQSPLGN